MKKEYFLSLSILAVVLLLLGVSFFHFKEHSGRKMASVEIELGCNDIAGLLMTGPKDAESFFNYFKLIQANLEQSMDFSSELGLREKQYRHFAKKVANHKVDQLFIKEDILALLGNPKNINDEILSQAFVSGVKNFLDRSGYKFRDPSFFKKFIHSTPAEVLKNLLFNSGILWGYPPVYFKGFSVKMIPDELTIRILEEGPSDELMEQISQTLKRQFLGREIDFEETLFLERVRKNISIGAQSIFLFMVMKDTLADYNEIEALENLINSVASEIGAEMESMAILEEEGFDLFGEEDVKLESIQCRAYRFCLKRTEDSSVCEEYRGEDDCVP